MISTLAVNNNRPNNNLICIAPECQRLQRRWYCEEDRWRVGIMDAPIV